MSADTLLYATLSGNAPVTSMVSTRVYAQFLPLEIVLPAVVIQKPTVEYINTIHNGIPVGSDIVTETWCLAITGIAAEELADVVEAALPAGNFCVTGRRQEFDPETLTYAVVVKGTM